MSDMPLFTTTRDEKVRRLESYIEKLEQENKELNEDLIETQKQASKVESELEVFQSFFVDKDHCYELEDKALTEWIAQHDKEVAVKAIKRAIDRVCRYKTTQGKYIVEVDDIDTYIEQLQEQE